MPLFTVSPSKNLNLKKLISAKNLEELKKKGKLN